MKLTRLAQATLPLLLVACASTSTEKLVTPTDAPAKAAKSDEDKAADEAADQAEKIAELERKLTVARAKLEVAQLEASAFHAKHDVSMQHAHIDVSMAQGKLAQFEEADKPNRLASGELSLQSSRDRAKEAAEELAQIEIMYADQDLNDKTAEFVINRGKRSAERAKKRLEIQEAELRKLKEMELPRERKKLGLALDKSQAALAAAERDGEIGQRKKEIAVRTAENEIAGLEAKLVKERKKKDKQEEEAQP